MRNIIDIPIQKISPDAPGVYQSQGVPSHVTPPERVQALYVQAEKLFLELARPKAVIASVSIQDFREVYSGNGQNDSETPLDTIYPHACALALTACTMGGEVSLKVEELMKNGSKDFALGFMLDSVASYSADKASQVLESVFLNQVLSDPSISQEPGQYMKVLMYSPGYCGWHVSGQGKLFEYLRPEDIGITLTPSYLMVPLKSISGVLLAGDASIHRFDNDFPFCDHCRTFNCRQRIDS